MERQVDIGADTKEFTPQRETQRNCIRRMSRLIQNLLDVARLDDGRLTLDRGLYTPQSLVDSVVAQHRIEADDRSIELISHCADDLNRIDGDARRIE